MSGEKRDSYTPVAEQVYFDPDNCEAISSENVQEAIDELCDAAALAASPGYSFGREGIANPGTWLVAAETLSNKRGLPFGMNNGSVEKITISTENIPSAFDVELFYHDGNLAGLTSIVVVTTNGTTSTSDVVISSAIPKGHQLAVQIKTNGATKPKEVGVFLVVKGTLT